MGYACPVCGDPQADDEHLANHLAFTAMLGDQAHEDWLAEHAPDWDEADADRLAATVTDHAETVEYPQVFEDTVDRASSDRARSGDGTHDHDDERSGTLFEDEGLTAEAARQRARADRTPDLDAETEGILAEAREMTRQMREDADAGDTEHAGEETDDTDPSDEAETE